jgi:hypothetical protein
MLARWLLVLLGFLLAGCDDDEVEVAVPPSAQGPVVMRVFDRANPTAEPAVLRAGTARQTAGVDELTLEPLIMRRLTATGVAYVHAPRAAVGGPEGLVLEGPVFLTGVYAGQPFTGVATKATLPPGARAVALSDVHLARAGSVTTTPRLDLGEARAETAGPFLHRPGAPALTAALAAIPPDVPLPPLDAGRRP